MHGFASYSRASIIAVLFLEVFFSQVEFYLEICRELQARSNCASVMMMVSSIISSSCSPD